MAVTPGARSMGGDAKGAGERQSHRRKLLELSEECRSLSRREIQLRVASLQETYDHLMGLMSNGISEVEDHEEVLSSADFALSKLNRALEFLAVADDPAGREDPAGRAGGAGASGGVGGKLRLLAKMEVEAGAALQQTRGVLRELVAEEEEHVREIEERERLLEMVREQAVEARCDVAKLQTHAALLRREVRDMSMPLSPVEMRMAEQSGFQIKLLPGGNCTTFLAPKGPVMLLSQSDIQAPDSVLRWKVRVRGNESFALGVVPDAPHPCPAYLFDSATVGINNDATSRASQLPRRDLLGRWIEIVADKSRGAAEFYIENAHGPGFPPETIVIPFASATGVRLAVATFIDAQVEVLSR
ncbi:hypothetical protein T484DRAFT_1981382 [Baffinella frigidus]|nr:hypothetical protein T484DRAFT_1981382 [Cryptophyta sp. CCMP2293]